MTLSKKNKKSTKMQLSFKEIEAGLEKADADDLAKRVLLQASVKHTILTNTFTTCGNNRTFLDKMFWSKDKLFSTQKKIRRAHKKLLAKVEKDMNELENAVFNKEEDKIEELLNDERFRKFYKLEIIERKILYKMFDGEMFSLVGKFSKYPELQFDPAFALKFAENAFERIVDDLNPCEDLFSLKQQENTDLLAKSNIF